MAGPDIYDTIAALRGSGTPFVVATVIRTADATSAKAGAKAAVTGEGRLIGHLGGACVATAVRTAAARALEDGAVRVIRVRPSGRVVALRDPDGAELFRSGCPSGGTVDLLIEPHQPPLRLVVLGASPVAAAIVRQAALLGFHALQAVLPGDEAEAAPEATLRIGFALDELALRPAESVIVAAQGRRDLDALRAALDSPAGHVAMVASRRKAQVLLDRLTRAGLDPARAACLRAPAGLDLGGVDPAEIALSVVAEIVQRRNRRGAAAARAGSGS